MRSFTRLVLILAAAAAAAASASAANGQCRLCDAPTTAHDEALGKDDVQLEIDTNLNFDRVIVSGTGAGQAVLRPDGSSLATGSIADIGARAMVATVRVHGVPGRALRIDVPRRIDLYSLEGSRLTFDEVVTDAADLPRLDSAGNLVFHIGGKLRFMGDEDGDYRGDLPITVEYP